MKSLSYSTLKEFSVSPNNLLHYWAEPAKTSPDIILGKVFEVLFLAPELFWEKNAVFFRSELPMPESTMAKAENKLFYADFCEKNEGKNIIAEDVFETAKKMCETADECAPYLTGEFEHFVKFEDLELFGVKFSGEADCIFREKSLILDTKKISNAHPDSLKFEMIKRKWHWQAYIYRKAFGCDYFKFLAVEGKGAFNFLEFQLAEQHYILAEQQIKMQCERYIQWNELGCPNSSYNFHLDNDRNYIMPFTGF